ncbi:ParB N-terminal domain-containing protein [Staphylococcus capitis]|nr:ParB N-terminal domain-containing protein [Staphylococcus capitis]DAM78052.1 MAG TPA: putative chromosome-partitioning protein [Caudoviricetes sp.]MBF2242464.1 ParB N-terminal domain-containing protein [Staphylococcus capitis]MBF2246383.1 ParB N-terminal domain-containing protein [Staphylococcus capitis]MBF8132207.1 ParB N-terminal domain-containing protein [Staphylococcus capitis]MBN6859282.1 ParB N-terminal domain-containing protein [Staphylococcus capitis]
MKEIENIEIRKLKFDEYINQLVPEMTKKEFNDLVANIEMQGQHTPIHINWDNTVLDGRHRIKALKELDVSTVKAIRENLEKDEALKFVRDTAVERRNLTANQKLNIVLSAKDLISDIQERAKEKRRKAMSKAHQNNPNNQKSNSFGSAEPKQSEIAKEKVLDTGKKPKVNQFDKPVHENNEIAKLAGVSKSTVVRAKKVKREDPETYERVIKENSGWNKAYNELPSVKNKEYQKNLKNKRIEVESEVPNEELELLAQSQTLIKRFQDLALCTKNSSDIEKVINKALKTDFEDIKEAYFKVERLFSLIGLKIETNGGTK